MEDRIGHHTGTRSKGTPDLRPVVREGFSQGREQTVVLTGALMVPNVFT